MYSHYYWPAGFENDQRDSNDDPVVIDKTLSSFNGDKMVDTMLHYVEDMR
jgi:hypothetical protein